MNFILVYALYVSTVLSGMVGVQVTNTEADQMRAGDIPPVVVPLSEGIPWLTEESLTAHKEFMRTHTYSEGKWRKL